MSLFDDKSKQPTKQMLVKALGKQYQLWTDIAEYVMGKYPKAIKEWKYPGGPFLKALAEKQRFSFPANLIYPRPGKVMAYASASANSSESA